jgi:enediyne biosynthesis protein E4
MIRLLQPFSLPLAFLLAFPALASYLGLSSNDFTKGLPVFAEIAKQAGVAYKIICGDEVTEFLIDVNGEGAGFLDYDNDGDQDIYLVNGSSRNSQKEKRLPHDYLLRNNGDGTFADVTKQAGLGDTEWSSGVAVGDFDNDGFLDLYVTNYGPNKLYRNNGDGTFRDVSEAAGVAGPKWEIPKWSMGAAFGDYDNDGHLDLFVTNFCAFNYQEDLPAPHPDGPCKMKGVPIACEPEKYDGQQDLLYHNNGNGTFSDVSQAAGIVGKDPGRGFAVVFSDFDLDGDQDIYVANDAGPNFYYENNGKGHFNDLSLVSGTAVDEFGNAQGSMGLTAGDFDNNGLQDILITNFIDQVKTLYHNQGGNQFIDRTTTFGLGTVAFHYSGWGTKFFDFDNDMWLDLFMANGHTMEQPEKVYPTDPFAEPNYVLRNLKGKTFEDVSEATGIRKIPNKVGRGTAFGDFDNDGDIDFLVINKNDISTFWRNDGGNAKNWLMIRAEGVKSNRSGIGARILVKTEGMQRAFEVRASDSYLSSNDLRAHIGLGELTTADIDIYWPSGQVDRHLKIAANRFYLAREGSPLKPDPYIKP